MSSAKESSSIQFIPMQETDLPRINALSNNPDIAAHFETIPPVPMSTTYAFWRNIQSGSVSFWGIHSEGEIIGGAGFYSYTPGTRLSHSATFFLYILPDHWRKGIGTKTISFLENEVQKRGYLRMECMVADTNLRAIRLYERSGFTREGVKKQAYLIGDQYVDLLIMGKVFDQT